MMKMQWKKGKEKFFSLFCQKEKEHEKKTEGRSSVVYIVFGLLFLLEMGGLFWNSGYVKGLNKRADQYKQAAIIEQDANTITAGDIYDRNHTLLVKTEKPFTDSVYTDGKAYSQILGYTEPATITYGKKISKVQRQYRLMEYYRDDLYKPVNIDGTKGRSLTLTLDHELQMKTKELLEREMDEKDRGSAIVMNAKTGEILSMVSFPTFDANKIDESRRWMNQADAKEEVFYPITHKGAAVPGSIFKIITSVALLDNDMEDYTAKDEAFNIGEVAIVNSYGSIGDEINYYTAIERSSNAFFANAGLAMGGDVLEETAKKFKVGEEVELDFGTINSNWDLDKSDPTDIAYTSFGQGKTLFSTIYAAMTAQTIANNGTMMKPYIVQEIIDAKGKTTKKGKPEVLSEVTGKETADKITKAMLASTDAHLSVVEGSENREIYERYSIASKTGTGENGDKEETNNAWFMSFAPADDPEYVVVVNQCKTEKFGQNMMDTAAGIYRYLFADFDQN